MTIGVEKLHCDLHAGAAAAFKDDGGSALAQMLARAEHFIERANLERHVMQLAFFRRPGRAADQCHTVMIGIAAHEHHAARHHVVAVDIRYLEAQHAGVKRHRTFEIGNHQHHMADFTQFERRRGTADRGAQCFGIDGHNRLLCRVAFRGL